MNTFDLTCALLSSAAYRTDVNPTNRVEPTHDAAYLPGFLGYKSIAGISGFEASAFEYQGKIVIAYAGTNTDQKVDLVTNAALALGITHPQLVQAAEFYLAIKNDPAYAGKQIVFTGHSLGGGLAAAMGVFFNQQAVTFDPAPFRLAATQGNASALKTYLALMHPTWTTGELATFTTVESIVGLHAPALSAAIAALLLPINSALALKVPTLAFPITIRGEGNIKAYSVSGEFLTNGIQGFASSDLNTLRIQSASQPESIAINPTGAKLGTFDLHSMNLLIAVAKEPRLVTLLNQNPRMTEALFDTRLYAHKGSENKVDFLARLVQQEFSGANSVSGTGLLSKFANDLTQLVTSTDGMTAQGAVQKALTVAAMDYYYLKDAASATQLFTTSNNGIHFKLSDFGVDPAKLKSPDLLANATRLYLDSTEQEALPLAILKGQDAWHIQSGSGGMIWTGNSDTTRDIAVGGAQTDILDGGGGADILIGGAGADFLTGGAGKDMLLGGVGDDVLNGGTGSDTLIGGQGTDIYQFISGDGADSIQDSDGLGSIVLNGNTLSAAKAAGERDSWKDSNGVRYQFLRQQSETVGTLVISTDNASDAINVKDFNLTKGLSSEGYLGIKLDATKQIAIKESGGTNVWADTTFDPTSLAGQAANINKGSGKSFTIFLNAAAKAGETLTLAMAGLSDKFKAILGDSTVDADGAVITLAEGQTQVSFALVQQGEVTADASTALSVSYQSADANASTVDSNSYAINLKDTGEVGQTYTGDQRGKLIGTEIDVSITADQPGYGTYKWSATAWATDGTLLGGLAEADFADVIYAGSGNDKIDGKGGNDALSGGAGNDQIDGGEGDDMIAGGAGSDNIKGGAGNDYISSSANLIVPQRVSPNDSWSPPAGQEVKTSSATWGVYLDDQGGSKVTVWAGMGDTPTGSADGDVIDGGAGDDWIMASWGDDRIMGGDGKDQLDGLAGNDIIEGGAGDDTINADGLAKAGYLNSVAAQYHGADFVDGGAGNDNINGGGGADQLYGGAGDDKIWGDSGGKTDNPFYVDVAYHGNDYIDGEDGNDYLEGGGKDDTLYGGAGNDNLWGDTSADNVSNPADNAALWGNDYLDGEDGNDELVGGGKDDTLYGGKGDDKLWGDEQNIALKAEYQGNDYLDGGEGNDYLEGGGKADTLFGGAGDDTLVGDATSSVLAGADHGDDYLDGEAGDDNLSGNGGNDTLYGGAGKDTLFGDSAGSDLAGEFHGADYLDGGEGDDYLEGGGGSDTLIGGAGADYLVGDMQGSTLAAQYHGDDVLDGGDGNDTLIGGGGNDTLMGGAGDDFISGDDALSSTQAGDYTGNDTIDGGAGNDMMLGGKGDDSISGGDGDDTLDGGEGDDTLMGGAGNDRLTGGTGRNVMDGGEGDDSYYFKRGDGFAQITDTSGFNRLYIEPGMQVQDIRFSLGSLKITTGTAGDEIHIEGFDPADPLGSCAIKEIIFMATGQVYSLPQLLAEKGFDLGGTEQADAIVGTALTDRITSGAGDDSIAGQAGNDIIDAGAGDDYVDGGDGNDTVQAGDGNDVLETNAGNDSLNGGAGDDLYVVGSLAGNTTIADAAGTDTLVLDWAYTDVVADAALLSLTHRVTGQVIKLPGLDGSGYQDVSAIENFEFRAADGSVLALAWDQVFYGRHALLGTPGADVLVGTAGDDLLIGLSGNDTLKAGDGNDTLRPGAGLDRLEGGAGDDVYVLSQTAGNKVIFDTAGADTLALGWKLQDLNFDVQDNAFVNTATGQRVKIEGFDISQGAASCPVETFEMSDGAGGVVQMSAQQIFDRGFDVVGTPFADVINGTILKDRIDALASDDIVRAGGGDDLLDGNDGNDQLFGDDGNDTIFGGLGNDLLDGGTGADTAYGGYGADTYIVDNVADVVHDELASWVSRSAYGNVAYELHGNEVDTVSSSVNFALGQGLDNLTLTGNANINGTGNWLANTITGNDGDNVIVGSALNGQGDAYGQGYYFALFNFVGPLSPSNEDEERAYDLGLRAMFQNRLEAGSGLSWFAADGTRFDGNLVSQQGDTLIGGAGNDKLYGDVDNDYLDGGTGNDLLSGGGGNDMLIGGLGDDTYVIDGGHSASFGGFTLAINTVGTLVERAGEGTDTVLSARDWVLADNFENLTLLDGSYAINGTGNGVSNVIVGNAGDNVLLGMAGDDVINGGGGNDLIDGGSGADVMDGGAGNDTFVVNSLADVIIERQDEGIDTVVTVFDTTLQANLENLTLAEGSAAVTGMGNAESNVIVGNQNDNLLDGGSDGYDVLYGGAGNDSLRAGYGELYGQDGSDSLQAGDGDNTLDGGAGADIMDGGRGYDTYIVDNLGDVASEAIDDYGVDSVYASVSHSLGQGIENLVLTGSGDSFGNGNELNNALYGNAGNNVLRGFAGDDYIDGGEGIDTMVGGSGNDQYQVDREEDAVVELAGQGTDTVVARSSYVLSDNVENLIVVNVSKTGPQANLTGNALDNSLTGNIFSNTIDGRAGDDTIDAQAGADIVYGGAGNDIIYGGDDATISYDNGSAPVLQRNDDVIDGGDGDDAIDGGSGNDVLYGGSGNDRLYGGDDRRYLDAPSFNESSGGFSVFSLAIGGGGGGVGLLPNDDYLDGGDGEDYLDGGSGDDVLLGGAGNDVLYGGDDGGAYDDSLGAYVVRSNNDYLDGGAGKDTLRGGTGNDTYVVDGTYVVNAEGGNGLVNLCDEEHRFGVDRAPQNVWTTDTVLENAAEGFDTVNTTASVNLAGQSIEVVNLLGSGPVLDIDAFTGEGDQTINGNAGNNRLGGGAGADTLAGGAGNDTYWVDAADTVIESLDAGFDTVHTEVDDYVLATNLEGLVLEGAAITGTGNGADNTLIGNSQNNVLRGGAGNDTLAGWRGNDLLQGGAGNDTYAFSRGDGQDTIDDLEGNGKLHFSGDITRADLRYSLSGNDLVINVARAGNVTSDSVTLKGWLNAPEHINVLAFCGGDTFALDASVLNHAPVAVADMDTATEDIKLFASGNVLANDSDQDAGTVLRVTNSGSYSGQYGTLVLQANGAYAYTLNNNSAVIQALKQGQVVSESFAYAITDGNTIKPLTAASTLTMRITGTNDIPVVTADSAEVVEDGVVQVVGNALLNDRDVDGDSLSVANFGTFQSQHGQLVLRADGSYVYTLDNASNAVQSLRAGERTSDVFAVVTTDGIANVSSQLTIGITGTNDVPVAVDDTATVREDTQPSVTGSVLTNDSDRDANTLLSVTNPGNFTGQYGTLKLLANGNYSYTLANSAAVQALAMGQIATDSFAYTATDGLASSSARVVIKITGENDNPVARADAASVVEDTLLQATGNVLTNDSDIDTGNRLVVSNAGLSVGQYGQLALAANGDYVYTLKNSDLKVQSLAAGQKVTETFSYTVRDDSTVPGSASANIVITVTGTNDAPTLDVPLSDRALTTGQTLSFALPATTFSDIDQGDVLAYRAQMVNAQGVVQALPTWLQFNAVTRTFSGTPTVAGTYSIRVTATDLSGATALDEFNIAVSATSTGGKGNEGLGNGQDAPPPGHSYNWNDGPGTSPGNPGRQGGGKPSAILTLANAPAGSREQLLESFWNGADSVISSVNYVLPNYKMAVILSGTADLNATGNDLDNWLVGNSGNNILQGGSGVGTDMLQGGGGNDQLTDMLGSNLLDGGDGNDVLTDGNGASYLLGGKGNDTLNLGLGADLIGFNRGDGVDIVNSGQETTANDVLSLGRGIRYTDLKLTKSGNDLKLDLGAGDSITFNKWYVGNAYKDVAKLQVLTMGGDYDAQSLDVTRNQKVEVFDFAKLAKDFDTARAAQAGNANGWAVMNSLLSAHLGASDTLALGGDLAYQYGTTGSLAGLGLAATQGILEAGAGWQNLNRSQESQAAVRLG